MMGLPNCREVSERLSREQDDPAHARRGPGMRMHLLICGACRRYDSQLRWLRTNLRRALVHADKARLSAGARQRIRRHLARDRSKPGA